MIFFVVASALQDERARHKYKEYLTAAHIENKGVVTVVVCVRWQKKSREMLRVGPKLRVQFHTT